MGQQTLQGLYLAPSAFLRRLRDTHLESANVAVDGWPVDGIPFRRSARDRTSSLRCRHLPCLVSRLIKFSRVNHQREVSLLSHSVMWFPLGTQPISVPLQSGLRFFSTLIPASPSVSLTASLPLAGSDAGLPCFVEMTG
jgi:hypothetical protein